MTRTVVQILGHGDIAELARTDRTDGQLLDLFVRLRDAEAFADVVRRHGPMVLGVCRRVLGNAADAEDAFQAAFLVLARKAATIAARELLPQWLHGVAYNTARKLRQMNTRRALREQPLSELPEPLGARGAECDAELVAILDEELARLPEHYRTAIVVCDLEGATRREAARRLGWPEGTVAGRLARARAMLAERLAGRGFVVPAGLLAAILAERPAGAAMPVLELVRAMETGRAVPRVADTTERVVNAMFVQKLKPVGLVLAMCGLALATIAGVAHISASAQPAPEAAEPWAKAGEKVFTRIPLTNLDPAETVTRLYEMFPSSVTVAAVRDEKAIIVYATKAATEEVRRAVAKIDAPVKPDTFPPLTPPLTVFRLKGTAKCEEVARQLNEVFNGPKGDAGRVRIAPVADLNALVVSASPADLRTIQKLIDAMTGDPAPAKPAAEPKKYTINFKDKPWKDVLDWYAKESGLTANYTVRPVGTVTISPPKDKQFTIAEVTDLINESMIQQKHILIRGEKSFTVVPADEKVDPALIPRIELSELSKRGKTELVQVLIPLKDLDVKDVQPEVQKMLTPFGTATTFAKTNTLIVADTAGNINRIVQTLKSPDDGDVLTHKCKHVKASELAEKLHATLTDEEAKGRAKTFAVTFDVTTNTVFVTGTPEKIALAKKIIEEFDKPAKKPDAPAPKKMSFRMKDKPWEEVLDWFSDASGLTPIYTVKPTGKFTHTPPTPDTQYTIEEIIDILNEGMASQKFILVRRQVSFTIIPTDEPLDWRDAAGWRKTTDLADLPKHGKTEIVQVLIPLKSLAVEETLPEVQKMLTPFGTVSMLKKMNTLVVVDTAGNVKRIADTIAKVDGKKPEAPMPATPKKMSLQMTDQPWEKVLEWYAEASGLRPLYRVKLSGTFTHTPPTPETRYTLAEVIDILNDALAQQKLLLVRRQVAFTVVSADEQPQQLWGIAPRIELSELPDRGRTELVQVMIPLDKLPGADVMAEVRKLLSPIGTATTHSDSLAVIDTAGNIRRVAERIAPRQR